MNDRLSSPTFISAGQGPRDRGQLHKFVRYADSSGIRYEPLQAIG